MAIYTREDVIPTLIENTTMQKFFVDGNHRSYNITPVEGYVLHDKNSDYTVMDPDTMEETYMLGYKSGTVTAPASYNFTTNHREFYALTESEVPADQIFGGVNEPEHEIM